MEPERLPTLPPQGRPLHQQALAFLQKGVILFQRKVYDGAIRALTEYGRELRDHSPSPVELKIATGLLGCRYGVEDLVAKDSSGSDIIHAFRSIHWPLSMRVAFASQIRWRIRNCIGGGQCGVCAGSCQALVQNLWSICNSCGSRVPLQFRRVSMEVV